MTTMTMTTTTDRRMRGVAIGIAAGSALIAIWAATVAKRSADRCARLEERARAAETAELIAIERSR